MKKGSLFQRLAAAPHILWAVMFIVFPMIFVLFFAFTDADGNFSFSNITSLSQYGHVFVLSIAFALIATVVCLIIGYPLAYFMSRQSARAQKILIVMVMLPMWCNLLIRTYALMALLDNGGLLNSLLESWGLGKIPIVGTNFGVILGMVYDFLPYMVLPIFTSMTKLDYRYIEASHDLGCNGWQVITKTVLPLSFPGILTGITVTFVPAVSTFVISGLLGGSNCFLIGDLIQQQFLGNEYNLNYGAATSLMLMVVVFISMGIFNSFDNDEMEDSMI
jgi:spermidine/putrescine transport system permease protein